MIVRQRIRFGSSALAILGLAVVAVLVLGLLWWSLAVLLLAFKFDPDLAEAMSGYRTIFEAANGLRRDDASPESRLLAGLIGGLSFLVFGYLAWKQIPKVSLARGELSLDDDGAGRLTVGPRAIERVLEGAARGHSSVRDAQARFAGDHLVLRVSLAPRNRRYHDPATNLRSLKRSSRAALALHGLPELPVDVTLSEFDYQKELR